MCCTIVRNLTRAPRKSWKLSAAIAVFVLFAVAISSAQATFTNLFDFDATDGQGPYYVYLVQGTDGLLYGTAGNGGGNGWVRPTRLRPPVHSRSSTVFASRHPALMATTLCWIGDDRQRQLLWHNHLHQ